MSGSKPKTIKMYCPSVSKIVQLVAPEEQRLDLGFIARAFGLDPSTLRLNGHFISRGVYLISSSVTWKSLISFFSTKGLSTGKDVTDPLIVDGKLSKVGTKSKLLPSLPRFFLGSLISIVQWVPFYSVWLLRNVFSFFLFTIWVLSNKNSIRK